MIANIVWLCAACAVAYALIKRMEDDL